MVLENRQIRDSGRLFILQMGRCMTLFEKQPLIMMKHRFWPIFPSPSMVIEGVLSSAFILWQDGFISSAPPPHPQVIHSIHHPTLTLSARPLDQIISRKTFLTCAVHPRQRCGAAGGGGGCADRRPFSAEEKNRPCRPRVFSLAHLIKKQEPGKTCCPTVLGKSELRS